MWYFQNGESGDAMNSDEVIVGVFVTVLILWDLLVYEYCGDLGGNGGGGVNEYWGDVTGLVLEVVDDLAVNVDNWSSSLDWLEYVE